MGGSIALTVRFEKGREYRGSCHTNVLPEGMWAPAFYIDLDSSKRHVDAWLAMILENRRNDPDLESMWGGHDMLAPLCYGIVIVDYLTSTLISLQGYSSPNWIIGTHKPEKFAALEAAGLLTEFDRPIPKDWNAKSIKMPFAHINIADCDAIDATTQAWCDENFGLTDAERMEWARWFVERNE
jgi:hypothetical protein